MVLTNRTMSFCPWSVLNGVVKPYFAGTMAPNSALCRSILVSIANPRVFHSALHLGSKKKKKRPSQLPPSCSHTARGEHGRQMASALRPYPPGGDASITGTGAIPKKLFDPLRSTPRLHLQHLPGDPFRPPGSHGSNLDQTGTRGYTHPAPPRPPNRGGNPTGLRDGTG